MKKSIKTIVVMLAIILTCVGVLAILSDLLYVSDDERIQRAIDKIYTTEVELSETLDVSTYDDNQDIGVIKAGYELSNGDYLILSTGKKGYANGSVTLYVAIKVVDGVATVEKTVQDSYTGQTLMSKLTDLYGKFSGKNANQSNEEITEIVSGATYSSNATSNAVIVALDFVQGLIGG